MNVAAIIEKAFCGSITTRRVPAGVAVSTQFLTDDGDPVEFYVIERAAKFRLIDDGSTIPLLEAEGISIQSGNRAKAFDELLAQYEVSFDPLEMELSTPWVALEELSSAAVRFSAFLLRIGDFRLLHPITVASTFRDDVRAALKERFGSNPLAEFDRPLSSSTSDFVPDLVLRSDLPVAVFVATSDKRLLEASVLQLQARYQLQMPVRVYGIVERIAGSVSQSELARAMNKLDRVLVYRGAEKEVVEEVAREARLAA